MALVENTVKNENYRNDSMTVHARFISILFSRADTPRSHKEEDKKYRGGGSYSIVDIVRKKRKRKRKAREAGYKYSIVGRMIALVT